LHYSFISGGYDNPVKDGVTESYAKDDVTDSQSNQTATGIVNISESIE